MLDTQTYYPIKQPLISVLFDAHLIKLGNFNSSEFNIASDFLMTKIVQHEIAELIFQEVSL